MRFVPDREGAIIDRLISRASAGRRGDYRVLDVGCGVGRNLVRLVALGYQVTGIDANEAIISRMRGLGHACFLPEEVGWKGEYDCILMSHIIEHFAPGDLLAFVGHYLGHLKPGGHLVVSTPLHTEYFFDDFTHIRPYPPESLLMAFGDITEQVNMRSCYRLELRDLWFRTSAFKLRRVRMRYLGAGRVLIRSINGLLALLHVFTLGRVGRKDGWTGLFQKTA